MLEIPYMRGHVVMYVCMFLKSFAGSHVCVCVREFESAVLCAGVYLFSWETRNLQ